MSKYTNLGGTATPPVSTYKGMTITQQTQAKRNALVSRMDEFTKFNWRGYDAWEQFGAFVINDKNSLKFYNGSSYKNSYVQPQFEDARRILEGISFSGQVISFKIGVYWISEDNMRYLLDFLNPYEKNFLYFNFETNYGYECKLNGIKDTTRWIIGKEDGKPMYYTEFDLSFDVLGANCARSIQKWTWNPTHPSDFDTEYKVNSKSKNYIKNPIMYYFKLSFNNDIVSDTDKEYHLNLVYQSSTTICQLFSITFNSTQLSQLTNTHLDLVGLIIIYLYILKIVITIFVLNEINLNALLKEPKNLFKK